MSAYYNEHDPFAAAWLRELIRQGRIAPGDVDQRDIQKVREDDLVGYTQVHLFAGIGGWSYALRLAGWPDDREVWTCSCPCQPFSSAGKQKGEKDARHLWPWARHLLFRRRPAIAFGEQVASPLGRQWLAGVRANLETLEYVVGCADLCAAGVRSPNRRQRLWWVADAGHIVQPRAGQGRRLETQERGEPGIDAQPCGILRGLEHADGGRSSSGRTGSPADGGAGETGFWDRFDIIPCRDPGTVKGIKLRRVEPGTFPLAHGVSGRVGMLRGYGNAINPQIAAEFICAYETTRGRSWRTDE